VGEEASQQVIVSGRDYSVRLMDLTIEPIVYSDTEISEIVATLVTNANTPDVTTNNVNNTDKTLFRATFNHETIFEGIKEMAQLANFVFYVDEDKDLHFEERMTIASNLVLDETNVSRMQFDTTRQGMANRIWVYGDRYLSGFRENINYGATQARPQY